MKKANFTYKGNPTGRKEETIYGTVTLKNDGKVSISLSSNHSNHYSYAAQFHAKKLAKEIAAADFEHPAVTSLEADNKSLVAILTDKTQELKAAYIQHTKEYAKRQFEATEKAAKQPLIWWLDRFQIKYEMKDFGYNRGLEPSVLEHNKTYYKMVDARQSAFQMVKVGYEVYEGREVRLAEIHYIDSISKLSNRLIKKGVDTANMKILVARIDMNIEITIDCNGVITRAWTIGAEGPVQRYHFRYLIK